MPVCTDTVCEMSDSRTLHTCTWLVPHVTQHRQLNSLGLSAAAAGPICPAREVPNSLLLPGELRQKRHFNLADAPVGGASNSAKPASTRETAARVIEWQGASVPSVLLSTQSAASFCRLDRPNTCAVPYEGTSMSCNADGCCRSPTNFCLITDFQYSGRERIANSRRSSIASSDRPPFVLRFSFFGAEEWR